MQTEDLLAQAIAATREGREGPARNMFLQVASLDPRNEIAWMWLAGLLDSLEDRIYACEQVLQINPRNARAAQYLARLQEEKQKQADEARRAFEERLNAARAALQAGQNEFALAELRALAQLPQAALPDLWRALADASPEWQERAHALERLAELVPLDKRAQEELERARCYAQSPFHQAELYEERGELDKALELYKIIAAGAGYNSPEWDRSFQKIQEIEGLKREKIAFVPPAVNIARLTLGPPAAYFFFALIHVGINPFDRPDPLTWSGLLWVALGSFLVAVSESPSHNRFWAVAFKDASGKGSPLARLAMNLAGWTLTALPFLLMFAAALYRFLLRLPPLP